MKSLSSRYLVPAFIVMPPRPDGLDPNTVPRHSIVQIDSSSADLTEGDVKTEIGKTSDDKEDDEDDYKIDGLFYRICYICLVLGVNFYKSRPLSLRLLSIFIIGVNVIINSYFIIYIIVLCYRRPVNPDYLAITLSHITWTLQATISTLFLAYWQTSGEADKMLNLIYSANKGLGIQEYRHKLKRIVRTYYGATVIILVYEVAMIIHNQVGTGTIGFMDKEIPVMFGNRRLFIIAQLSNVYSLICWGVALFVFSLFVHSTNCEFLHYNDQVRAIAVSTSNETDNSLCDDLLRLMKIHVRLTVCVQRLDEMFHKYAFIMIVTIIPTTTCALFMLIRRSESDFVWRSFNLLCAFPLVIFCLFSFYALTNSPSQLHETIYTTKSVLCANTNIWFPYRPNVYHSALAFVCHLDQMNLGVSIWGFAVVTKQFVLATLSAMITCLALFMELGDDRKRKN